jgi:hypothetical protein
VQRGDAVPLVIHGTEAKPTHVLPAPSAKPADGHNAAIADEQTLIVKPSACTQPASAIQIVYTNSDHAPHMAELRVNGQDPTRILFPPTGPTAGSIWIQALLDRTGKKNAENNRLSFSTPIGPAPQIEYLDVYPNKTCSEGTAAKP